jgi:hypothetical protein
MKSSAKDYPTSLSTPIDRTAARVISKGTHFEFKATEINREIWEIPPPLVFPIPESIKALIGTKKGDLTVIGYLGAGKANNKGARILVRCVCGKYEKRVANKWRKPQKAKSCCHFCELKAKLKVSNLPYEERNRIENMERARHGFPLKPIKKD